MQTRRGCGHRSGSAGENGLIAFPVHRFIAAPNVRRQRHVADPLDSAATSSVPRNRNWRSPNVPASDDFRLQRASFKNEPFPDTDFPARFDQGLPEIGRQPMNQQDFDFRLEKVPLRGAFAWAFGPHTLALREQPGGNHASVVDDNQLVAPQDFRKLGKLAILVAARTLSRTSIREASRSQQGLLGDELGGSS